MEAVYTFCIQKLDKMYTTDVYKRYMYCIKLPVIKLNKFKSLCVSGSKNAKFVLLASC